MTARAEYTDEEWNLLETTPYAVGLALSFSDGAGLFETLGEMTAMGAARARGPQRYPGNELVAALVTDRATARPGSPAPQAGTGGRPEDAAASLREMALQSCRDVVALLEERSHAVEAEGYKRFLMDLAVATATASRHGRWFSRGPLVDEQERALLCEISAILGIDVGDLPEGVTCAEVPGTGEAPAPDAIGRRADGGGPDIPSGPIGPE